MSSPPITYSGPVISSEVPWETRRHLQLIYQKLGNHVQGISLLSDKVNTLKVGSTATVFEGGSGGGGSTSGVVGVAVNNQIGQTAYSTMSGDNNALIVFSDASPIAVTLNSQTPPWSCSIVNQGVLGTVTLTPSSGLINGASSLPVPPRSWLLVAFDGTNWWATSAAGLTGSGTTGYIPAWTGVTSLGDSHIDDGVTTSGVVTSHESLQVLAPSAIGATSAIDPTVDLSVGPAESTLVPLLIGYTGARTVLFTGDNSPTDLGIEFQSDETVPPVGLFIAGVARAISADNPWVFIGFQSDIYTDVAGAHNFTEIDGIQIFMEHAAPGTLARALSVNIQSTVKGVGAGAIAQVIGLFIDDQTAGTANWAIKTGLGLNEFGDTVKIHGVIEAGIVYSAAGTPLPSAATVGVGARAFVSDATVNTFASAYAGSGANKVPVYSDGTAWFIG